MQFRTIRPKDKLNEALRSLQDGTRANQASRSPGMITKVGPHGVKRIPLRRLWQRQRSAPGGEVATVYYL